LSKSFLPSPTSRCRLGIGRVEITPPIGIYHRFWGAAKHDQATGVHRPLTATVLITQPLDETVESDNLHLLIAVDHCLFRPPEMDQILAETARLIELDPQQITFTFSHTHSGGNLSRSRAELPGGDRIGPYLDSLPEKFASAFREAVTSQQSAVLTYAVTRCDMGHNRDYRDDQNELFVCGFNPDDNTDLPVHVIQVADDDGKLLATVVNYPCHPTTLAWDNTLISPDYIGAMRETVEEATEAMCLFLLAPCGEIGPKYGFVGDVEVADRNGRQLAYAALSALESMPPSGTDYHYNGPVISGATIGSWEYRSQNESRCNQSSQFRHHRWTVPVSYRPELPTLEQKQQELECHLQEESTAREQGNEQQARDARALAERCRRASERLGPLPSGSHYPYELSLWQIGDAFWVAVEGEPYNALQKELHQRFPDNPVIVITLANGSRPSYIPRKHDYDKELYQVEIAVLEPGSLEKLTEEIASQIQLWLDE
jgi:hypothetical protein